MPQTKRLFASPEPLLAANLSRLPARAPDAHKGQFGHVLLIGGDRGLAGLLPLVRRLHCAAVRGWCRWLPGLSMCLALWCACPK